MRKEIEEQTGHEEIQLENERFKRVSLHMEHLGSLPSCVIWPPLLVAGMKVGLGAKSGEMGGVTYQCQHEDGQPAGVLAAGAPGPPLPPLLRGSGAGAQDPRDSGMQGGQGHSGTNPHPSPPQTCGGGASETPVLVPGSLPSTH